MRSEKLFRARWPLAAPEFGSSSFGARCASERSSEATLVETWELRARRRRAAGIVVVSDRTQANYQAYALPKVDSLAALTFTVGSELNNYEAVSGVNST